MYGSLSQSSIHVTKRLGKHLIYKVWHIKYLPMYCTLCTHSHIHSASGLPCPLPCPAVAHERKRLSATGWLHAYRCEGVNSDLGAVALAPYYCESTALRVNQQRALAAIQVDRYQYIARYIDCVQVPTSYVVPRTLQVHCRYIQSTLLHNA